MEKTIRRSSLWHRNYKKKKKISWYEQTIEHVYLYQQTQQNKSRVLSYKPEDASTHHY
jgi:hypothetical protein